MNSGLDGYGPKGGNRVSELVWLAYLFEVVGVEKDPAKLDELGRVLGNVDAMLIAGSCDVDDHVPVDLERGSLLGGHGEGCGFGLGNTVLDSR